jgi:hypothetical protein
MVVVKLHHTGATGPGLRKHHLAWIIETLSPPRQHLQGVLLGIRPKWKLEPGGNLADRGS